MVLAQWVRIEKNRLTRVGLRPTIESAFFDLRPTVVGLWRTIESAFGSIVGRRPTLISHFFSNSVPLCLGVIRSGVDVRHPAEDLSDHLARSRSFEELFPQILLLRSVRVDDVAEGAFRLFHQKRKVRILFFHAVDLRWGRGEGNGGLRNVEKGEGKKGTLEYIGHTRTTVNQNPNGPLAQKM